MWKTKLKTLALTLTLLAGRCLALDSIPAPDVAVVDPAPVPVTVPDALYDTFGDADLALVDPVVVGEPLFYESWGWNHLPPPKRPFYTHDPGHSEFHNEGPGFRGGHDPGFAYPGLAGGKTRNAPGDVSK